MASERNQAPACKWWGHELACGTRRQTLYVNGAETPFFIDSAKYKAHRIQGDKHGLLGAGMGPLTRAGWRGAAILASGDTIAPLKHRAEQMALERLDAARQQAANPQHRTDGSESE